MSERLGSRNAEIRKLRESGASLGKISDRFGITRERVRQIVGPSTERGFARKRFEAQRDWAILRLWELPFTTPLRFEMRRAEWEDRLDRLVELFPPLNKSAIRDCIRRQSHRELDAASRLERDRRRRLVAHLTPPISTTEAAVVARWLATGGSTAFGSLS